MSLKAFDGISLEVPTGPTPLEGLPPDRGGVVLWRVDGAACGSLLEGLPEDASVKLLECSSLEAALAHLSGRRLRTLAIQDTPISHGAWDALAAVDCRGLALSLGADASVEDLGRYARAAQVRALTLLDLWAPGEPEERAWVQALAALRSLEDLRLSFRATPPRPFPLDLGPLQALPGLQSLHLEDASRLRSLAPLSRLEQLRSLHLHSAFNLEGDPFAPLGHLLRLESLSLECCSVVDEDLVRFARLPGLRRLGLGASFSARALAYLASRGLRARGTCTGEGFAALAGHGQLAELDLTNSDFPAAAFRHVARLPRLAKLALQHCDWLDDTVLDDLCGLRLEDLRLDLSNDLTPAGLRRLFREQAPALRHSALHVEEDEAGTTVYLTDLATRLRESKSFQGRASPA